MEKINNKLINDAINDVLDKHPNFWDWSTEEVTALIIQAFKNKDNWFYEFIEEMGDKQIETFAIKYLEDINFWNLEK